MQIRAITEEEFSAWERSAARGFGEQTTEARRLHIRATTELERTIAAFNNLEIVGTSSVHSLELMIPGSSVPLAYLDWISVLPTHRRMGILTNMMRHTFADLHDQGEAISGLTSTESSIYERFGYGISSWVESYTIKREHSELYKDFRGSGQTQFVEPSEVKSIWPKIYDLIRLSRVGMFRYTPQWWNAFISDPEHWRQGGSQMFHVVYHGKEGPEGLASYRIRNKREVVVVLLLGTTLESQGALWQYCFGIDLMTSTFAPGRPVDDPLIWLLRNSRMLNRSVRDKLWIRLIDVPKAIATRSYASECDVTIQVNDPFCRWNQGCYQIQTSFDGAICKPSRRLPDVILSASDLASIYLGGTKFVTLQRAGRIVELRSESIKKLDQAFAIEQAPWTFEMF